MGATIVAMLLAKFDIILGAVSTAVASAIVRKIEKMRLRKKGMLRDDEYYKINYNGKQ